MNILITGGAGFLGSILVGKLLDKGYEVTVLDNLMYGQTSLLQYCNNPNFKFVWGDVDDNSLEYQRLVNISDYIFPLACLVGAPSSTREKFKANCINWTSITILVDYCRIHNLKTKIIFPTTNSGYGTQTGDIYCIEETPLQPISPYGKQKVEAEKYILNYYENAITLRLATVFGCSPRMRLDLLVNYTVWKAITDKVICVPEDIKDNMRNYLHIEDATDCFLYCIDNFEGMKGNAYNVGNDIENMSVWDLSTMVANYIQCELVETHHYIDKDRRNYIVSNDKLRKYGFEAKRTILDELPNLVKACEMIKMLNYGRTEFRNA